MPLDLSPDKTPAPAATADKAPAPAPDKTGSDAPPAPAPDPKAPPAPAPVAVPVDWMATLNEDNRKLIENKNWKDPNDLAKAYAELERAYSNRPEAKTYQADEYKLTVPDTVKDAYDPAFADEYRKWAIELKISPETAAKLHDKFLEKAMTDLGAMTATQQAEATAKAQAAVEKANEAERALVKAWGSEEGDAYKRNAELAMRAVKHLGLGESLVDVGLAVNVEGKQLAANAKALIGLAKVGGTLYAEDTIYGKADLTTNPFAKGSEDMRLQGVLIGSSPAKARALMEALPPTERANWDWWLKKNK